MKGLGVSTLGACLIIALVYNARGENATCTFDEELQEKRNADACERDYVKDKSHLCVKGPKKMKCLEKAYAKCDKALGKKVSNDIWDLIKDVCGTAGIVKGTFVSIVLAVVAAFSVL